MNESTSKLTISPKATIEVTAHGAIIKGKLTRKDWTRAITTLRDIKTNYLKALGDVVGYGRRNFGDEVVGKVIEQLEFDLSDANTALGISTLDYDFKAAYPLTAEHYFVLSKLTTDRQRERWAAKATRNKLSALELKRSIDAGKILTSEEIGSGSGQGSGITTIEGALFQFNQWKRQLGGEEEICHLPEDKRLELLEKLSPIIELVQRITETLEPEVTGA